MKNLLIYTISIILLNHAFAGDNQAILPTMEFSYSYHKGHIERIEYRAESYSISNDELQYGSSYRAREYDFDTQIYQGKLKYPILNNYWVNFEYSGAQWEPGLTSYLYGGGVAHSFSSDIEPKRFSKNRLSTEFSLGTSKSDTLETYASNIDLEYSFNRFVLIHSSYNRGVYVNNYYQQYGVGLAVNVPLSFEIPNTNNFDGPPQTMVLDISYQKFNTTFEQGSKLNYKVTFPVSNYASWFYAAEQVTSKSQGFNFFSIQGGVTLYVH